MFSAPEPQVLRTSLHCHCNALQVLGDNTHPRKHNKDKNNNNNQSDNNNNNMNQLTKRSRGVNSRSSQVIVQSAKINFQCKSYIFYQSTFNIWIFTRTTKGHSCQCCSNLHIFTKVNLQAPQKVRVGLDLTVDKIHLDELDNTLGIHVHIKVYMSLEY